MTDESKPKVESCPFCGIKFFLGWKGWLSIVRSEEEAICLMERMRGKRGAA